MFSIFKGLPRGVRGDALECRGHPYLFYAFIVMKFNPVHVI
jgi:hypothetical protein